MTIVRQDQKGATRDLPIAPALVRVLQKAGEAAKVDVVRVTSGGQCKKGTCTKRTGSERHDLGQAADLQLLRRERALDFTRNSDLPVFETFIREAARAGATGVGAGVDYMGPFTVHVGFGSKAVWGAGGKASKAPDWIKRAARDGWALGGLVLQGLDESLDLDSDDEEEEETPPGPAGVDAPSS
jgi:hypothetical protein